MKMKMKMSTPNTLNSIQKGKVAELLFQAELLTRGCEVYVPSVDDRGVDLVIKPRQGIHWDIQVKSCYTLPNYVFFREKYFSPSANLFVGIVISLPDQPNEFYLINSLNWSKDSISSPFVFRSYEGRKSAPEYGLSISKNTLDELQKFKLDRILLHNDNNYTLDEPTNKLNSEN